MFIVFSGCEKKTLNDIENDMMKENVSFDDVIKRLNEQGLIVFVKENYTDEVSRCNRNALYLSI